MRILRVILFFCIALVIQPRADDRNTLFEGLGLRLVSIVDSMTDKKQCALFVSPEYGPIYLSIEGPDKVTIWPKKEGLLFASDAEHLVRIGEFPAFKLQVLTKRNGLAVSDSTDAASLVKALAKGERVRVRYVEWPSYEKVDVEPSNFALPYVWSIASEKCGWPSLGMPAELPPAKLDIYQSQEPDNKGYARITVNGNRDLGLLKGFDKYGGGCQILMGVHETVGIKGRIWMNDLVDLNGRTKFVVRDKSGGIIFESKVPTEYGRSSTNPWPAGEQAVRAMWQVAPFGTAILDKGGYEEQKVMLYGFKEVWSWGVQNCSLPSLEK
jgi:hypothetical protein